MLQFARKVNMGDAISSSPFAFDLPNLPVPWSGVPKEVDGALFGEEWYHVLPEDVSSQIDKQAPQPSSSSPILKNESNLSSSIENHIQKDQPNSGKKEKAAGQFTFQFLMCRENPTSPLLPPLELCRPVVFYSKIKDDKVKSHVSSWTSKKSSPCGDWAYASCMQYVNVPLNSPFKEGEFVVGLDVLPWLEALKSSELPFRPIQVLIFAYYDEILIWKKAVPLKDDLRDIVRGEKRIFPLAWLRHQQETETYTEISESLSAIHAHIQECNCKVDVSSDSDSTDDEKDQFMDPNRQALEEHVTLCRAKLQEAQRKDKVYLLSHDDMAPFYGMQRDEVALKLGICVTLLKKMCRRLGVKTWPYRKLRPIHREIEKKWRNQKIWRENARTGANPRRTAKVSNAEISRIFDKRNCIAKQSLGGEAYRAFVACEKQYRSLYLDTQHADEE